jgi:hypothetical protein
VYRLQWNSFQPNIFISSAADWVVKVWDKDCRQEGRGAQTQKYKNTEGYNGSEVPRSPLYTFDLASQAGDVAWAPYSR